MLNNILKIMSVFINNSFKFFSMFIQKENFILARYYPIVAKYDKP